MFTRSDLAALMDAAPSLGVSIFLPTHVRGSEIRQDPIRLKNLAAEARDALLAAGLALPDVERMLAPAAALVEDYKFWQHQSTASPCSSTAWASGTTRCPCRCPNG